MAKTKKSTKNTKKVVKAKAKKVIKKVAKKTVAKKAKTVKKASPKKEKKVTAVPKGYNTVTPYLIVNQALNAIAFYTKAFDAKEVMCMKDVDGSVKHAELQLGDTRIMLADECPEMNARSPQTLGGSPISIHLYVPHVDAVIKRAISAGAILVRPVADMYYGDRTGGIMDPFGHIWFVSTHIEDVTPAEIKKRSEQLCSHGHDKHTCESHA